MQPINQQDLEQPPQEGVARITALDPPAAAPAPAYNSANPPPGMTHNQFMQWQRDQQTAQNAQTIADRAAAANPAAAAPTGGLPAQPPATPPATTSPASPQDMPGQQPVDWGGQKPQHLGQMPDTMPGPEEWKVTQDQLVQGQMKELFANQKENPLFQSMRDAVVRAHASRGGQNSLMANSAAEAMIVDTVFKIAQADAQTIARSAEFNAMAQNQFSLANQQFMHNAMLSDQNFNQAMAMQEAANEAALNAAANAAAAYASANADEDARWRERNQITHGQTLEIIQLQHGNTLARDEVLFGYDMQGDTHRTDNAIRRDTNAAQLQYQSNWNLAEQAAQHQSMRDEAQFGHQLALNYQSEVGANSRALVGSIAQIGSTEGLTAGQQQAAIGQLTQLYTAQQGLLSAFYTAHTPRSAGPESASGPGSAGKSAVQRPDYLRYTPPPLNLAPPLGGLGPGGQQQPQAQARSPMQSLQASVLSPTRTPAPGAPAGMDWMGDGAGQSGAVGGGNRMLSYADLRLF